jgi:hypothetical protein
VSRMEGFGMGTLVLQEVLMSVSCVPFLKSVRTPITKSSMVINNIPLVIVISILKFLE